MDEIRCDEPSYLIWKWHPHGSKHGNNNRENAIRCGSSYNVVINGQAAGPLNTDILRQKAVSGQFFPDSLVWKSGMSSWEKAETIDESKNLFTDMMPPIPTNE